MCDINFHCLCHTSPEVAYRRGSPFSVLRSSRQWCPSGAKGPMCRWWMGRIHSLQDAMHRSLGWDPFQTILFRGQLHHLLFWLNWTTTIFGGEGLWRVLRTAYASSTWHLWVGEWDIFRLGGVRSEHMIIYICYFRRGSTFVQWLEGWKKKAPL